MAAPGFFAGSFCYFLFQRHKPDGRIALILAALSISSQFVDHSTVGLMPERKADVFALLAAYPTLWLGYDSAPNFGNWGRYGDLSYGLYIFGWPVQQIVRHFIGDGWNGWSFFAVCLPIALVVAYLSWNLIEKPALSLRKSRILRERKRVGSGIDPGMR